ncbi:MAG: FHA domain-containing protein [Pseudomonadota bacterium]
MPLRFHILSGSEERRANVVGGDGPSLVAGPVARRTFELARDTSEVRIGRRPDLEMELPFPSVSSLHARLFPGDLPGAWWVEDLDSMNGSWLDGHRLTPRHAVPLRAGQRLRIATVDIVFDGWSAVPRGGAESTATIARRLIGDLFDLAGGGDPLLVVETATGGPGPSLCLAVRDHRYLAGRGAGCDLVLTGEHVSREHAAFVRGGDGVRAFDLGSKNGVLVNGGSIPGEVKLADGDRLGVGSVVLIFGDPEDRALRRLRSQVVESTGGSGASSPPSLSPRAATGVLPSAAASAAAPAGQAGARADATPVRVRVVTGVAAGLAVIAVAGLVALWLAGN